MLLDMVEINVRIVPHSRPSHPHHLQSDDRPGLKRKARPAIGDPPHGLAILLPVRATRMEDVVGHHKVLQNRGMDAHPRVAAGPSKVAR